MPAAGAYLSRSYGASRVSVGLGNMVGTPADLVKGAQEYFEANPVCCWIGASV